MYAIINHTLLPLEQAVVPVNDLSVQRGYGVFDFFRTQNGIPLFLDEHLDRLERSAASLHLELPYSRAEWKEQIRLLMQQHRFSCSGIRITVTGGSSADMYTPGTPRVLITEHPLTMQDPESMHPGFRLITHEHVRELPEVKSINYLVGVWLQPMVKAAGADDVLFVNDGWCSELPRSNVFMISKGGTLLTPSENILNGITREKVLSVAREIMPVEGRPVSLYELLDAAEAFVTSTTKRLIPILSVNSQSIGNGTVGEATKLLYQRFVEMEQRYWVGKW
ncbi:MAG TPA: aminotransferase class IV [Lacibacter sp.]|nr:aminotransferase class IV [Lacibacter sp.]HMO90187.1 aminotransferase class IV [Lacibacter sp.]